MPLLSWDLTIDYNNWAANYFYKAKGKLRQLKIISESLIKKQE